MPIVVALKKNLSYSGCLSWNDNGGEGNDWLASYTNPGCDHPEVLFFDHYMIVRPDKENMRVNYEDIVDYSVIIPDGQKLEAKTAKVKTNNGLILVHIEGGGERTRDVFGFVSLIGKILRLVETGNL